VSRPDDTIVGAGDDTTILPTPLAPAAVLAWGDDDTPPDPVHRSWRGTIGYGAILLSCAAVIALLVAIIGWVETRSNELPPLVTSVSINGTVPPSVPVTLLPPDRPKEFLDYFNAAG
jgi:hypothetical protein